MCQRQFIKRLFYSQTEVLLTILDIWMDLDLILTDGLIIKIKDIGLSFTLKQCKELKIYLDKKLTS